VKKILLPRYQLYFKAVKIYNLNSFKSGKNIDSYAKNATMIFGNKGKNVWNGKVEFKCSIHSDTDFIKLEPNGKIPFHKHLTCEEVALVIDGNGLFNDKGKKIKINKGDLIFFSRNESHDYIAGEKGLNILVFHAPPMKDRRFVK